MDEKPRTASLFKSMSLDTITLDDALRLLSLPRVVGAATTARRSVANGRYGPYIKKGTETRSLESEEQLFTIDADEARALLAQPKQRRGRGAAKPPLKELGPDPASGKPIVVKDGRFGPYVTDGETNASLRRGDEPRRSRSIAPPSCSPSGAPGPGEAEARTPRAPRLTRAARPSKLSCAPAASRAPRRETDRPERNTGAAVAFELVTARAWFTLEKRGKRP